MNRDTNSSEAGVHGFLEVQVMGKNKAVSLDFDVGESVCSSVANNREQVAPKRGFTAGDGERGATSLRGIHNLTRNLSCLQFRPSPHFIGNSAVATFQIAVIEKNKIE